MNYQIRNFSLFASSILLMNIALAKPVTVKDWSLDDSGAVCVASTTRTVSGQTYRFELSFDKSGLYPVEAWVREIPTTATTQAFRIQTEVAPIQSFAMTQTLDANGAASFWQVPTDTNALISYIKRQTRLMAVALTPNGAAAPSTKNVDFSLRGSSDIVDALITQCNKGKAIVQSDFEKSFIPVQVTSMDPLKFDYAKSAELRRLYLDAVKTNADKIALQGQLTTLNTQYAKLIQELAAANGSLDQMTKTQLVNLQNQKTALTNQIASLDQQLLQQKSVITAKETEVSSANAVYDQAWGVLAPYEAEHKRLNDLTDAAKRNLSANQSRLADIDQSIRSKTAAIDDSQSEVSSLQSQMAQADSAVQRARYDVDQTGYIYQRFDAYRERDERIGWHPITRFCRSSHAEACNNLMYKVSSYADQEVSAIQNRLSANINWAQNNLTSQNNVWSQLDAKIRNLTQIEIPRLRDQISDLRSQRPSYENAVNQAQNDVINRSAATNSYDQSVGYAAKKADVNAKAAVVVKLQNDLKALEATQTSMQNARNQNASNLAATDRGIQDLLTKIQQTQGRTSELNKALEPYFATKAQIESSINLAIQVIQADKAAFAQSVTAN
jgi:predicted  nucleic acid-binding Zn-ribbon protein